MEVSGAVTPPFVAKPLRLDPFPAIHLAPGRVGLAGSVRLFSRPHRGAAARRAAWEERRLLRRDTDSALYLHEYGTSGMLVRGLIGALDVSRPATFQHEPAVLPHEAVYPAQADALAAHLHELDLDPAPILLVQRSPADLRVLLGDVRRAEPTRSFTDRNGATHRQWAITDPATIDLINLHLAATDAVIADGHHRYAAHLRLQQRYPAQGRDHALAMLVDHDDTPLFLGAIHRLLRGTGLDDVTAAARAAGAAVEQRTREPALASLAPGSLVATDGPRWAVIVPAPGHDALVEWLHGELIPLLGRGPRTIRYHHDVTQALAGTVRSESTAVLLPAPTVDEVITAARRGRLLPEKATSFQPKPPFGIALRELRDG